MTGAGQRYDELRVELMLQRAEAGGELPQEAEARFAAELDRCWEAMTDAEQEHVENSLRAPASSPQAPEELGEVDQIVSNGGHEPPRVPKAA